ncbi:MAG: type IV pilus biogenesis/stability protein PilW [Pseudomonadota bacterium]
MNRLRGIVVLAALLAGCATTQAPTEPTADTGTLVGDVGDPRNRARVHTELAALYYRRGNMAVALEELRIAAAADASYALTYSMFGLVYAELKENQLAQTNFERALRLSPADPDINHNYGWFLCNTGRETESIKYFLQAVRNPLYPAPWRSYSAAGICTMRKGNLKEAEDFFQRALQQEPDDPGSLLQLGQIRYRQGSLEQARKLVGRFNKLVDPTPESLWLALRIERKLGERLAEASFANQLRRRFSSSREYQQLQRGEYD